MTNEDRRAKPEDRSAFTPEVRERLFSKAQWSPVGPVAVDRYDLRAALTHIDALEARATYWYEADGTVVTLSPEEVTARRIAAAKELVALKARVAELELKVIAKTADATSLRARVAVLAAALNEAADAWPRPNKYDDILGALEGGSRG